MSQTRFPRTPATRIQEEISNSICLLESARRRIHCFPRVSSGAIFDPSPPGRKAAAFALNPNAAAIACRSRSHATWGRFRANLPWWSRCAGRGEVSTSRPWAAQMAWMRNMCMASLTTTIRRRWLARAITASLCTDCDVLVLCVSAMMVRLRHARAHQVLLAHAALGVGVAAGTAQGDDQGRDAAVVEALGMVQPRRDKPARACRRTRLRRKPQWHRREPPGPSRHSDRSVPGHRTSTTTRAGGGHNQQPPPAAPTARAIAAAAAGCAFVPARGLPIACIMPSAAEP